MLTSVEIQCIIKIDKEMSDVSCEICKLNNNELIESIEKVLDSTNGTLDAQAKNRLKQVFPDLSTAIEEITSESCMIHWNFHQSIKREIVENQSLTQDINKDEGAILSEFLNKQAATFNCLTKKINKILESTEEKDLKGIIVNPNTLLFYKDIGDSIRSTVKELRELNNALNGKKDTALEGLKAIAAALRPNEEEKKSELTTNMYD